MKAFGSVIMSRASSLRLVPLQGVELLVPLSPVGDGARTDALSPACTGKLILDWR
jgi:hypothetical protein